MRILPNNIAVLDGPDQLSRWVEEAGRLCHDDGVAMHYLPHIKPGDVVIDAGAAIGDHTIAYLERVGPTGVVHAFEANPLMFECLAHNCPGALLYPMALSDEIGRGYMGYPQGNVGAGAVHDKHVISFSVAKITLDSFYLQKVDFIKMDIEGSEYAAIVGALGTLARCRPKMIIEICDEHLSKVSRSAKELEALLNHHGYTITPIMGDPKEGRYEALCLSE